MLDRAFTLGVSILLASLIWLYASSREQEMLDNVPVPVQIALVPAQAEQFQLEVAGPAQVPVSFSGPAARIRELRGLIQRGEVHVDVPLTVPEERLQDARYADSVRIDPSDLQVPPGVTPILVEGRNRVPVVVRRMDQRSLPVRFEYGADERVARALVEPAKVQVRGPVELLDKMTSIATKPFVLPSRPEGLAAETLVLGPVPLEEQFEGRPLRLSTDSVTVRLTLQPRRKLYEVEAPIHFLCPANFPRRPKFRAERDGKLTVRLIGPASEEAPKVSLYIDLTAIGKFASASPYYDEPLQVQLPSGFQLAQPLPRFVAFELAPGEAPAPGPGTAPP